MHDRDTRDRRPPGLPGLLLGAALLLSTAPAFAQPTFSEAFQPATIGPGSVTTVTFTIDNSAGGTTRDLAFVDTLPAGLVIASPARAFSSCSGATVAAPDGGSTITFSNGALGAGASCTVNVDVTAASAGTYVDTTGALTSDAGNSGTATATLVVDAGRPGFAKSFSPATVPFGGRSTLTFTIDNSANGADVFFFSFTDPLPSGMTVASPSNATTNCGGATVTAAAGGSQVAVSSQFTGTPSIAAGATCTVVVDVIGGSVGTLENLTGELTAFLPTGNVTAGKASAALTVVAQRLALVERFVGDPVRPGDTVVLETTITNLDRRSTATDIAFSNDLDATLSGLVAVGLPSLPCGAGSSLTGTSTLTLTGGTLASGASCTFTVTLQVPAGATAGAYVNTTGTVTGTIGGTTVGGASASDTLIVSSVPALTKTFLDDPAGAGSVVSLEFTIMAGDSAASAISFTDNLDAFLSGTTPTSLPANGFCGTSSTIALVPLGGENALSVAGANLAAGASCSFTVDLAIPAGAAPNVYTNTTSALQATVDGSTALGDAASDTLEVVAAPFLRSDFVDDPVLPGDSATLRFTLFTGEESTTGATDITFTADLAAALSGLAATGLPLADVCGAGSSITGTTTLSFTGGSLAAGGSCVFDVTVQVPASALPGSYSFTTSILTATAGGVGVTGNAGADELDVAGLSFSKDFVDDPVIAGGTLDLEYTITNSSTVAATDLVFTENLNNTISGLSASGLPLTDPCGADSSLSASGSLLIFSGGNLAPGTSCTFAVPVTVPAGTSSGQYTSSTSNLSASVDGTPITIGPANAVLEVASDLLLLTKEFVDDPVPPGGQVTLEFTLSNFADDPVTDVAFTDDLDAALAGLVKAGAALVDPCGAGSMLTGTDLLAFTGGSLAAGASCTFSVTLDVPPDAPLGSIVTNATSELTGTVGGLSVFGPVATAELQLDSLTFAKSFDGPVPAGDTIGLTFQIENPSATETVVGIEFADDLEAVVSGLVAVGTPIADVCGTGSMLSGVSLLQLTDAFLPPGGSCTFTVDVEVPIDTEPGTYLNVTTSLGREVRLAGPASAELEVTDGCFIDDFEDGVVDPAWTLVGIGNANQQSVLETGGVLALTADGATAFYGADNAGFLYQSVTGDFRLEAAIDSTTMTTGGLYRKAGLMARASLDPLDIRLIAQVAPFWENQDEVHYQFVARESYSTPGRLPVARDVIGGPRVVRFAVERVGDMMSVEYSTDGGATWIRPATGLGGSITISNLPETLLVGLDMVSNDISTTSTVLFEDAEICPILGE